MKKKAFIITILVATGIVASFNHNRNKSQDKLSHLVLENIEALAGCESDVKHGCGRSAELTCRNNNGDSYKIQACDFDMAYSSDCEGRPVN